MTSREPDGPAVPETDRPTIPHAAVAAGFVALAFALRSSTFFHSVENWDESLYLLMARSLLEGHVPYTEVWNHKPPGIAVLFALGTLVFRDGVLAIRVLACLAVSTSALLLYEIGRSLAGITAGLVAGVFYLVFSLDYGLSSCLELFFAPLVLFAFWVVLSREVDELDTRAAPALAIGAAAGIALQLKFVVVFDFAALGLFVLGSLWARERSAARLVRFVALASIGPVAVFGATALAFAATGHFADYWDANFAANARYVAEGRYDYGKLAWMVTRRVRESFPLWLCLLLAPLYVSVLPWVGRRERRGIAAGLVWAIFALLGIFAPRRLFAHYFLALLPAQCLLCALVASSTIEAGAVRMRARTALLLVLAFLGPVLRAVDKPIARTVALVDHRWRQGIANWGDEPAQVAATLRPNLTGGDLIYVADYHPILYYVLAARAPTKFLFPPFLVDEEWSRVTGIDREQEVRAVFARRPRYVVKAHDGATPYYRILREELGRDYELDGTVGSVEIYRRRGEPP
jgi:4-amino-4-deoxy-L-arabinose transferase-like glycosyltransferase